MPIFTTTNSNKRHSGFTLVELLVVVAIIALMVGAAGGIYGRTYHRQIIENDARELVLAAQYASVIAIAQQKACKLNIDAEKGRFFLTMMLPDSETGEVAQRIIQNQYHKPVELQEGVSFKGITIMAQPGRETDPDESAQAITFFPNGLADAAIILVGDEELVYSVSISPANGQAKMVFGPAEQESTVVDLDI